LAVVAIATSSADAQMMTTKTLDRIKLATVRVLTADGETGRSGAGVVVKLEKNAAYVVTAADCVAVLVDPKDTEAAEEIVPPKIAVLPTNSVERIEATLVGVDMERDLALLKIEADKSLVGPLDPGPAPVRLTETMAVYSFGFADEGGDSGVAPAVKRVSVVSIRRSAPDENGWIRVDNVLGAGHIGGPVVDAAGRLVGVSRQPDPDDKETVLTPRGEVKTFVDAALKGQMPKIARKIAPGSKVVAKPDPGSPKKGEAKVLPGGIRLVEARWGVLVDTHEPLIDAVDASETLAKLLAEGKEFEIEDRLFPSRATKLRLALHCSLRAGDEIVEAKLPLRSQVRLIEPGKELADRTESVFVDSAIWSVDRTFNPAYEEESRDLTALVREKAKTFRGCQAGGFDLPELRFGRPKVLMARIKLGERQLELRIGEPGLLKIASAK
jgi:S1-C subfamily serine protease